MKNILVTLLRAPPHTLTTLPTSATSIDFLDHQTGGVYTTARVLRGSTDRVFELRRHFDRLNNDPMVLSAMSHALVAARHLNENSDCKLTVVLAKDEIQAHVEEMKAKARTGVVRVAVGGPHRENAKVKDLAWVEKRKGVVDDAAEDTLLMTGDGEAFLEGSQTNLFVIMPGGDVWTAGSGVLEGTVRACVLDACVALGIPVVLCPPLVKDLDTYQEAFLASTSRLVLAIDVLGTRTMPTKRPVTERIAQWVKRNVEDRSISVREYMAQIHTST